MLAFERKNIFPVCKNFLRFAKGQGFRDLQLNATLENTSSKIFLGRLREELLKESPAQQDFMNKLFNNLNEFTTDLFVIFKEIIEHDPEFRNG